MSARQEPWGSPTPAVSFFYPPPTHTHTPSLFLSHSLYPAFPSHFRCAPAFWHISQNLLYCDKHHMSSFEIKIRVAYLLYWPIFAAESRSFEAVCVCVCTCAGSGVSAMRKCSECLSIAVMVIPLSAPCAVFVNQQICFLKENCFCRNKSPDWQEGTVKRKLLLKCCCLAQEVWMGSALSQTAADHELCFLFCYQDVSKHSRKWSFDGFELLSCNSCEENEQNIWRLAYKFVSFTLQGC